MILALAIPYAVWAPAAGTLLGGLIASVIVAYTTQRWIEGRERRNRRDDLRLELYLEVVDLVLVNEILLGKRTAAGRLLDEDVQARQRRISHRMKLLGTRRVQAAYTAYCELVHQETAKPVGGRPADPEAVDKAREALIEAMAEVAQPVR